MSLKEYRDTGKIIMGVGGRYTVRNADGELFPCGAKGTFRREHMTPTVGDTVDFIGEDSSELYRIERIHERRNCLIRPAISNLSRLMLVAAAKDPAPSPLYLDKMLSIAEYQKIHCAVVVNKCDLDAEKAGKIESVYRMAGYKVFPTDTVGGAGIDALRAYLGELGRDEIAAFAGASGVGKSSLINALFPTLRLTTGTLSDKIARGRHTTRQVELHAMEPLCGGGGYLADTPGFSMLDFERFDFYKKEDLPALFCEFVPYLGKCRYTKCSHTKEDGCAILAAVKDGKIAACRHRSYCAIFDDLKNKNSWE